MEERRELRRAALSAARKAREPIAAALRIVQADEPLTAQVLESAERASAIVRLLYAIEAQPAAAPAVTLLGRAMERSQELLAALREVHDADSGPDPLADALARALAVLYPVCRELERALFPEEDDREEPPIPLARPRGSHAPERRRAPRAAIQVDIGLHSESNFFTALSGDVSDGGIFVATHELLEPGSDVDVSFVLPGGHHVTALGRVTWVRTPDPDGELPPGMGIRFARLEEDDRRAIEAFMRARDPILYET
ncbi:MAG: TIGR02266 family protein [Myxococcota bacterium]|nr:TIGR02266 family protein [Myxococcota bacterium]MDW8362331.1 TIGR02266 family protein [Myxococcales bacterium]